MIENPAPASSDSRGKLPAPLRGVVPPALTPLSGHEQLDVPSLERLLNHLLAGGVHGIFILGTTGEAAGLSARLRREVVRQSCRIVAGRRPVLVGITDTSVAESIELARFAADAGAAGVVIATPFYLPLTQAELARYVKVIVDGQPLPVMLYNIPSLTKTAYEVPTIQRLLEMDRVAGIKDSSGDMDYLYRVRQASAGRPGWTVLVGLERHMADGVLKGLDGGVPAGANVAPRLLVDIYEAALAADTARLDKLRKDLAVLNGIYRLGEGFATIPRSLKCAAACLGICQETMAEPYLPFSPAQREEVARRLREVGLLL